MLTLEKVLAFLKVDLTFACCWPLPVRATKSQKIRDKIFRWCCCMNGILMSTSLIYTVCVEHNNMSFLIKAGCALCFFLYVPIQIILFTLQSDRLQVRNQKYIPLFDRSIISIIIRKFVSSGGSKH